MNNLGRDRQGSEDPVTSNQPRGGFFQNLFPTLSNPPSFLNEGSPSKKKSIFTVTSTMGVMNGSRSEAVGSDLVCLSSLVNPDGEVRRKLREESPTTGRIRGSGYDTEGLNILQDYLPPLERSSEFHSSNAIRPTDTSEGTDARLDSMPSSPLNRHNSLENLHHPKNHRSTAKKPKSRKSVPKRSKPMMGTDVAGKRVQFEEKMAETEETQLSEIRSSSGDCNTSEKDCDKRMVLLSRASTAFALGAVRRLRGRVDDLIEDNKKKTRESAARLILHNLLLNSWRQCRKHTEKVAQENNLHLRTIENMCLQLRVLRQMHREEKERSQNRNIEISELSIQIATLKRDADVSQSELDKVETELNNCQVEVEGLQNDNNQFKSENERLNNSLMTMSEEKHKEFQKVAKMEKENMKLLDEISQYKKQVQEVTKSRNKWQEEARSRDSEIIGLKTELSNKDKHIQQLQISQQDVQRELFRSQESKLKLQLEEQHMALKISQAKDEIQTLSESLIKSDKKLDEQNSVIETLTKTIETQQGKISHIQDDLSIYLRQGIERRRKWANTFHYLVFPFDILSLIYEPSQEQSRYAVNLQDVTCGE